MWRTISARFFKLHSINLREHVKAIIQVKPTINAGFDFVPVDADAWGEALKRGGFQPDRRERILGIIPSVGSVAGMATHGQGYRENSEPSLHCAVAKDKCNVHLDNIGIRLGNYNANAPEHVVDERAARTRRSSCVSTSTSRTRAATRRASWLRGLPQARAPIDATFTSTSLGAS